MRTIYVKSNILRRRDFAINTSILEIDGEKLIIKKAVYPEGFKHLKQIYSNQELLKKTYPNVEINKVWLLGDELHAEFIDGISLTALYRKAVQNYDRKAFFELFDWHLGLFSDPKNICTFEQTDDFKKIFGDIGEAFYGEPALKIMNFDSMSDNILFRGEGTSTPIFIDYEWVFDFPTPLYFLHLQIVNSLFVMLPDLDRLVTPDELLQHGGLSKNNIDYKVMWDAFWRYYRFDNTYDLVELHEKFKEKDVAVIDTNRYYINELERGIQWYQNAEKERQAFIDRQQAEIKRLNDGIEWHLNRELDLQKSIEELYGGIEWHQERERELQHYIESQQAELDSRNDYINKQQVEIDRLCNGINWHRHRESDLQSNIEKLENELKILYKKRLIKWILKKDKEI